MEMRGIPPTNEGRFPMHFQSPYVARLRWDADLEISRSPDHSEVVG